MSIPVPKSTSDVFIRCKSATHPGLLLDKFVDSFSSDAATKWQQGVQLPTIERVVAQKHLPADEFKNLFDRHAAMVSSATSFRAQTTGPLTMHLSRAGALENAGICLHPLYGFAYLPGTGLKGLARAYAETIARPAGETTDADIRAVFGHAPTRTDKTESAGAIIFHDAWPTAVPQLIVDIVNNHHCDYYNGTGNENPPGDWEDPVPVYFIAVAPKTTFHFALARRRDDTDPKLIDLARSFLLGGLLHLGAGAKTNAGYGSFVEVVADAAGIDSPEPRPNLPTKAPRTTFACTLELVSPAFLAGAKQDATDCDLRPATLRGQLRWWWRTLHSGYLSVEQLRTLEAAIWGDTSRGGAVRIGLETKNRTQAKSVRDRRGRSPSDPIKYITYGMDDDPDRPARFYLEPGATWSLTLTGRASGFQMPGHPQAKPIGISSTDVYTQATAALWLLCTFGGVGAKARKGFGSLAIATPSQTISPKDIPALITSMQQFRKNLGLPNDLRDDRDEPYPVLDDVIKLQPLIDASITSNDVWAVMKDTGQRLKDYVSDLPKPDQSNHRAALGLPRGKMQLAIVRHPAPYHIHLNKTSSGYTLNAIAFTAHRLPSAKMSREVLDDFLAALDSEAIIAQNPRDYQGRASAPVFSSKPFPKPKPVAPKEILASQELVGVLEFSGNLWLARFEGDQIGHVVNPDKVPGDAHGKQAKFRIMSANKKDGIKARFDGLK
jgi:CRISPR-associated protein Cmr6